MSFLSYQSSRDHQEAARALQGRVKPRVWPFRGSPSPRCLCWVSFQPARGGKSCKEMQLRLKDVDGSQVIKRDTGYRSHLRSVDFPGAADLWGLEFSSSSRCVQGRCCSLPRHLTDIHGTARREFHLRSDSVPQVLLQRDAVLLAPLQYWTWASDRKDFKHSL